MGDGFRGNVTNCGRLTVLMADDDPDDCLLAEHAWTNSRIRGELRFVHDGEELLDYLRHRGKYADLRAAPVPALILLDLNMPKMDGREALGAIKSDPELREIPVIVLTTSKADEDIVRTYDLGVNSYIAKPVSFDGLLQVLQTIGTYWLKLVQLPTM